MATSRAPSHVSARPTVRPRRARAAAAAALPAGALALAALSLLAPSVPSYDPFAWLVWGRELVVHGQSFSVVAGPSWKPLPVLFTASFALVGGTAAPALWLLVARAGGLLALAGAFALGSRLAGRWAGAVATLGVLLSVDFVTFSSRGASEGLLVACVLWAIERELAGRHRVAFALAVAAALIRPEVWPFLALYALVRWRAGGGRERWLIAGGLLLVGLLWFGPPAVAGDPFAAGSHAVKYDGRTGSDPAWTALRRGLGQTVAVVWLLALLAVRLRAGDRAVRALALGAAAWLALVVAMTVAGFPGLGRFMLPAAAVACVLAGVGAVAMVAAARGGDGGEAAAAVGLVARVRSRGLAAVATIALLVAVGALSSVHRVAALDDQVRLSLRAARVQAQLTRAIAALGGRAAVLRCAAGGAIATNHTAQTALAWKLRVGLDRVAPALHRSGLVFRGPKIPALGVPPAIALGGRPHVVPLARAGVWRVLAVRRAGSAPPAACRQRA